MKWICKGTDHIENIALQCLFKGWKNIWEHDANGELRKKRKNPNLLFKGNKGHPGDELEIPDAEPGSAGGNTLQHHLFQTSSSPLCLRLRILREDRTPLKDAPYSMTFEGESKPRTGRTDDKGQLVAPALMETKPLWRGVARATLTISLPAAKQPDGSLRAEKASWVLRIGALNPILEEAPDEQCTSGVQQRLNNLGFPCGAASGELNEATREAIRAFQKTYGLAVDGTPTAALQSKLAEVHDRPNSLVPPAKPKRSS